MLSTYATTELTRYRQQDLLREANAGRVAAQARAHSNDAKTAPWESTLGRVRHAFSVFAALPRAPQVRIARDASRA